jgi:hypothetical protein
MSKGSDVRERELNVAMLAHASCLRNFLDQENVQ